PHPPRAPPPFPTRRSSDLSDTPVPAPPAATEPNDPAELACPCALLLLDPTSHVSGGGSSGVPMDSGPARTRSFLPAHPRTQKYRSEEHTSELQSRENLVCR